jgi:hypothetical protein
MSSRSDVAPMKVEPILQTLADDLLSNVGAIAFFYLGKDTPKNRRIIYRLVEERKLPVFRDGNSIKARKSRLLRHITEQEDN